MLIVPAVLAAVYIGLLKRHFTAIGAAPPHRDVMDSARKDRGWRWFKVVGGMLFLFYGIKIIAAFFQKDVHDKLALSVFGLIVGIIILGGLAYFLGWLTAKGKPQGVLAISPPLSGSTTNDTSVVDAIYLAIDQELTTANLERATWTRAQGDAEGDSERTKALYIKYRAQKLLAASPVTPIDQSPIAAIAAGTLGQKFNFKVVAAGLGVVALIAATGASLWYSNRAPKGSLVPLDLGESKQPKSWDEVMADSRPISKDVPKGKQPQQWEDYSHLLKPPVDLSKGVPKTVQPDAQAPWVDLTEKAPKGKQPSSTAPKEKLPDFSGYGTIVEDENDAQVKALRAFRLEQEKKINKAIPDWREIVGEQYSKTPYRQWLAKQPAKYQTEMNSTDSADLIIRSIARFKAETK